jgi:DegV family protein with EDD domain
MSKIAIVTDSSSAIPREALNGAPVFIVPLQVIWGEMTYRDNVDIQSKEFYERLAHADVMPTTSQPSPAAFHEIYSRLLNEGHEILSIHISSKLSGTMDSAIQAKQMLEGAPLEIVDSDATSMALGFQVLNAVQILRNGATLKEAKEQVENVRSEAGVYFVVNTLEFLHRGGRIGGGAAFLGTVLDLKPVLQLRNGRVEAVERVRTMSKAVNRLLDLVEKDVEGKKSVQFCAIHANAQEMADMLRERACARFGLPAIGNIMLADISPAIGSHTGPGTVGFSFFTSGQ